MKRAKIAAGNWKMHLDPTAAQKLVSEVIHMTRDEYRGDAHVIFAPSFPLLPAIYHLVKDEAGFSLAAQNLHQSEKGAFTGEVSAEMLLGVGTEWVIIGHSERRQIFGESNALLAEKVNRALEAGLKVIFCVGESLEDRRANRTEALVADQLRESLWQLNANQMERLIVAYEPIWAIGTGETATPDQAQSVHKHIRSIFAEKYGPSTADNLSILYGGSVKPDNANELFAQADIDGGLVGGASLKSRDFTDIIKAL